jgi:L-alanine-DL-glutamate epimerase-like enolase superfamily enzyme
MRPITAVRARAVSVPVANATKMSTRVLDRRDFLLVEVSAGNEPTGVGYAYVGTRGGGAHAALVDELLAPVAVGHDADDIVGLWERLYRATLLSGRRGGVLRAVSAIDIALWDLKGKRLGVPVAVLLGGAATAIPAYASGGYYKPDDGDWAEAVVREVEHDRAEGFRDHKIKVGGLSVAEDAKRVEAAASVIGTGGRLALDANNAYADVDDALYALRAFEAAAGETGLWWFEEPLLPDDIAGHAAIAAKAATPVATGEIHQTRWEFRELIERRAASILQPDLGVAGGITEWMTIAQTAASFGIRVAPHWHANVHAQVASAVPNLLAVEYFDLDKDIYNFERLLTPESRLKAADGMVHLSDRPGIGIEFEEAVLDEYS